MQIPLAMIGPETGLIILVVVLVLFGGKKIPELMRGVGQGIGELKKGVDEAKNQVLTSAHHEEPVAPVSVPAPAPVVSNPPASPQ